MERIQPGQYSQVLLTKNSTLRGIPAAVLTLLPSLSSETGIFLTRYCTIAAQRCHKFDRSRLQIGFYGNFPRFQKDIYCFCAYTKHNTKKAFKWWTRISMACLLTSGSCISLRFAPDFSRDSGLSVHVGTRSWTLVWDLHRSLYPIMGVCFGPLSSGPRLAKWRGSATTTWYAGLVESRRPRLAFTGYSVLECEFFSIRYDAFFDSEPKPVLIW